MVGSNEKIVLKDPETANDGLNGIRFEEWGDKEWLNNNYVRAVRIYLDAFRLGEMSAEYIKHEEMEQFNKHKELLAVSSALFRSSHFWVADYGFLR